MRNRAAIRFLSAVLYERATPPPARRGCTQVWLRLLSSVDGRIIHMEPVVQRLLQRVNGSAGVGDRGGFVAPEIIRSRFHFPQCILHITDGFNDARMRRAFRLN